MSKELKVEKSTQKEEKVVVVSNETAEVRNILPQVTAELTGNSNDAMSAIKAQLEEQLKRIAYKNEIANNREKFLETKKDLVKVKETLGRETMFESNDMSIIFKSRVQDNYSRDSFSISNRALILKFIDCLSGEIDAKVREIETELIVG